MRAWLLRDTTGPSGYALEEIDVPEPGPEDVRVMLRASALNHLDLWVSKGLPAPHHFPHIAGGDGAGIIDAVGEEVTAWAPGDEVVINPSMACGACQQCQQGEHPFCDTYGVLGEHVSGTLTEQIVLPARNIVAKPPDLTWEESAAYGLAAGTAFRMLERARLGEGDNLLIIGIGGGVATMGLQLGVALGANVYVTSTSPAKLERAIGLGAVAGFDSAGEFSKEMKAVGGADVVLESVGPATWAQTVRSMNKGGRIAVCGSTSGTKVELTVPVLFFKQLEIIGSTMFTYAQFDRVTAMMASGNINPVIDSVTRFEDLPKALEKMERGDQFGKLVIGR